MERTNDAREGEGYAPVQREMEFSFVQFIPKAEGITRLPPTLNRESERSERRSFEVTFRKPSMDVAELGCLRRTENDVVSNWKAVSSWQKEKEGEEEDMGHNHIEQADKTSQSSSSQGNYVDEKFEDPDLNEGELKPKPPQTTKRLSLLIKKESDSNAQFIELDCEIPNVYESQILLNRDIEDYGPQRANICGSDYIQFSKFKISLMGMAKVKVYPQIVKKKSFRIKITHESDVFNFGVELRRELYYLPEHYVWFAKLVNARLMKKGCKFLTPTKPVHSLSGNGIFNQGVIYKCSKYRKRWDKRFILINNQGLFSYKNPNENYTVSIPSSTILELWTNFELFGSQLIIKVKHTGGKTEFAIPVLDYCLKQQPSNWLFSFYRLLMEHKIHIKV